MPISFVSQPALARTYMVPIVWLLLGVLGALGFVAIIRVKSEQESKILAIGLVVVALI